MHGSWSMQQILISMLGKLSIIIGEALLIVSLKHLLQP